MKEYRSPKEITKKLIQVCDELGIAYLDREKSCPHKTYFCARHCYYNKFFRYPSTQKYLGKAGALWELMPSSAFAGHDRVRLCKVGDPFSALEDIERIFGWARENPDTLFKAPTRAWRNPEIRSALERARADKRVPKNLRILASLDPSNTKEEIELLHAAGWSTMFFGDDVEHPLNKKIVKCPKTWEHKKGACKQCANGCFGAKQAHVWLKKH